MLIHERTRMSIEGRSDKHGNIILRGPKGMGKMAVAKELASLELGISIDKLSDSACYIEVNSCKGLDAELISSISEQVRCSLYDRYVIVIDDADLLNDVSQNRLLKALEDDSGRASYYLVCHTSLLDTIVSRCVCIDFPIFTNDELYSWAYHRFNSVNEIALLGAHGTPGTYIKLIENKEFCDVIGGIVFLLKKATKREELFSFFELTGNLKEGDKDNIFDNFEDDYLVALLEIVNQLILRDLKYRASGQIKDCYALGKIYDNLKLCSLALKTAKLKRLVVFGKAKKDDFFEWLIYLVSPELAVDSKEEYIC